MTAPGPGRIEHRLAATLASAMGRREFIALVGGAIAWPLAADAQRPGKMPRLGILNNGPAALYPRPNPFLQGLEDLGYVEGQNLATEFRFADWKLDRLPALAAELVAIKVDVIVAVATPAARAAKRATNTIPIVAVSMGDPVGDELVASLGSLAVMLRAPLSWALSWSPNASGS